MYTKIDHIGIAVRSLETALETYRDGMGLEVAGVEEVAEQKTRVALLPVGESRLELLEATDPASPIAKFLVRRGEGLHHVCLQVEDIAAELAKLKAAKVRLIDEEPRRGAGGSLVAFVHPTSTGGVLVELAQAGRK